jgi:uncharacterized membrane protein
MQTNQTSLKPKKNVVLAVIFLVLITVVTVLWLDFTPAGLTGKLSALAYSVCHQNPNHTLTIGGKLLPLCARCTGTFMGSLVGMAFLRKYGSGAAYPAKKLWPVLAGLILFFAIDGANSAAFSFFSGKSLYTPSNVLRLISGLGMGLVIASLLVSIWRQTMRLHPDAKPGLDSWGNLFLLLFVEASTSAIILFGSALTFYPIAILSTLTVPILLTMVYTLLWILMLKKENTLRNWKARITYILLGCLTAFVQIGALDLIRFAVTKTWAGIQF